MASCGEAGSLTDRLVTLTVAGYTPPPSLAAAELMLQCEHCNDKRKAAKTVQELSSDLFFACFVKVSVARTEKCITLKVAAVGFLLCAVT